jgi:hypothetical protein
LGGGNDNREKYGKIKEEVGAQFKAVRVYRRFLANTKTCSGEKLSADMFFRS